MARAMVHLCIASLMMLLAMGLMAEAARYPLDNPSQATCKNADYKECYNLPKDCPKSCGNSGCHVNCVSCEPVCGPDDGSSSSPPRRSTLTKEEKEKKKAEKEKEKEKKKQEKEKAKEEKKKEKEKKKEEKQKEKGKKNPPVYPSPPTPTPSPPVYPSPPTPTPSPPVYPSPPTEPTPSPPVYPSPPTEPTPSPPVYPSPPTEPTPSPPTDPTPSPPVYPSPPTEPTPSPPSPTPTPTTPSTPPSSEVSAKRRARCRSRDPKYNKCYNVEHVCPAACPTGCVVDCVTCRPMCNCDQPGAVCQDPRFIGGDGITFYFHGKQNRDFCLLSDSNLHINAHFIGKRNQNLKRDFTWVQAIGILFGDHQIYVGAQKTAAWDDSVDRLGLTFDGQPIYLPESEGAKWQSEVAPSVTITRSSMTNNVIVEVEGNFKISANVVPITEEESKIHSYGITKDDCFAHLDLGFKFYSLGQNVNGVLGQTYAKNYVSKVKMGASMPVMGGDDKFIVSNVLAKDCAVARFTGSSSSESSSEYTSISCSSGIDGRGVVCKK